MGPGLLQQSLPPACEAELPGMDTGCPRGSLCSSMATQLLEQAVSSAEGPLCKKPPSKHASLTAWRLAGPAIEPDCHKVATETAYCLQGMLIIVCGQAAASIWGPLCRLHLDVHPELQAQCCPNYKMPAEPGALQAKRLLG